MFRFIITSQVSGHNRQHVVREVTHVPRTSICCREVSNVTRHHSLWNFDGKPSESAALNRDIYVFILLIHSKSKQNS